MRHRVAGAAVCLAALAPPASAQIRAVKLQPPPRDFGYFVGDMFTATAAVTTSPDTVLDVRTLPIAGPVSASIDVRTATVSEDRTSNGNIYKISVVYQTFFSPENVSPADVPGYSLAFSRGTARLTAAVPGFTFAASVFRHDLQPAVDPAVLRPDPPTILADDTTPQRNLAAGLALAFLGLMILWSGHGWRIFVSRRSRPFADVARAIRKAPREVDEAARRDALLALHRAFDATAGRRVLAEDIASFVRRHPCFESLRDDMDAFFAASQAAFFGPDQATLPITHIVRFSRALARAERSS